ncbi:MAG TPA: four helix bundle protein [Gemmataceae bacterium]|nr:four helix bundle protein [Gemmataceae bacterium]
MRVNSAKELTVYDKAYGLSMRIFRLTEKFPTCEQYALIGQMRRSSRSVCMNLREAWAKRRYEAHFVSKLTDCDGENSETDTSLDFACDCGYITPLDHKELTTICAEVGRMLGGMLAKPKHSSLLTHDTDVRLLKSDHAQYHKSLRKRRPK